MAFVFTPGFNKSGQATKNVAVSQINASDFVVTQRGTEDVTETNLSSGLATPECFQFGRRIVKDIYANTSVDTAYKCPSKTGIKILLNWTSTGTLTDDKDVSFRQDFPLSVRTTITVPASDYIGADDVLAILQRAWGGAFEDGTDVTSARISELLRGALDMNE